MLAVTILGNNSAVPAFDRHPTSQIVSLNNDNFMVDCGEGTQIQLINYKIRRSKISRIFISHLHGDHYFGLIGLINSFSLLGRKQDLHVYGPAPLQQLIELQLKVADNHMSFDIHFHTIRNEGILVDDEQCTVKCFRTNHRIECYGFSFAEKPAPRKLLIDKVQALQIPHSFYASLKAGQDYITTDNIVIPNTTLTADPPVPKSYAFCADTKYDESLLPHIAGFDMIYHETTYLDHLRDLAQFRFHSTTRQAATIAQKAGVKKLLMGHFSSKYDTLDEFETEAREVFPNSHLALEGVCYRVL